MLSNFYKNQKVNIDKKIIKVVEQFKIVVSITKGRTNMYKLMICDDEPRVARLISNLIDWNRLDIELIGIANDGISSFEMIKEHNPNIVITDIRMPGYDGIELIKRVKELNRDIDLIIISGYKHFEYAHNAIKYGVKDYLLKPINKQEINNTLQKMVEKYEQNASKKSEDIAIKEQIKRDEKFLQESFVKNYFENENYLRTELDLKSLNTEYRFNFTENLFQALILKTDINNSTKNINIKNMLEKKSLEIISKSLKEVCSDYMIYTSDKGTCFLINYSEDKEKSIRKILLFALEEITLLRELFDNLRVTIGLGNAVDINQVSTTIKQAYFATYDRLIYGTNKIIEGTATIDLSRDNIITKDIRRQIGDDLYIITEENLLQTFNLIKSNLKESENINGKLVFDVIKELIDIYFYKLKNVDNTNMEQEMLDNFYYELNMCSSIESIFNYVYCFISKIFNELLENKKQQNNKPIRFAKGYINENYNKPITLEEVSSSIGFCTAYFSTLFKKETGTNFLEYLTMVRVNKAQEMLRDQEKSIDQISFDVGYNDVKHFAKQFKKITGLSPSKYRKFYC